EQSQVRRNPEGNTNKLNQGQTTAGSAGSSNKGTSTGSSNAGKYRNRRRYYNKPKDAQSTSGPKPAQQQTPKPGQASSPQNNPVKPFKNEPEIKK
ncbi:MAG: hypothetical protein NTV30_04160, partial [Chloroflexi bacterium]|nr:hypothetical protein [Chloroflexota bacterium]